MGILTQDRIDELSAEFVQLLDGEPEGFNPKVMHEKSKKTVSHIEAKNVLEIMLDLNLVKKKGHRYCLAKYKRNPDEVQPDPFPPPRNVHPCAKEKKPLSPPPAAGISLSDTTADNGEDSGDLEDALQAAGFGDVLIHEGNAEQSKEPPSAFNGRYKNLYLAADNSTFKMPEDFVVQIVLTGENYMRDYLDQVLKSGLYGDTYGQIVEGMVWGSIRYLIEIGAIEPIKNKAE